MALSKKRTVDSENRAFNPEWTHSCSSCPLGAQSQCVSFVQRPWRSLKVPKCHYETKHKVFDQTFPLKSELRSQKISSLRAQYDQSTRIKIKTEYRSRLTNEHLHVCMRMALTPFQPRSKQYISH